MASRGFVAQVEAVAEAFGLSPQAVKNEPEGLYLRTADGLVYVFFEGPHATDRPRLRTLFDRAREEGEALVVLSPAPLPPADHDFLVEQKVAEVTGERYRLLLVNLGLDPGEQEAPAPGVLPTAFQLDEQMARARHWEAWGLPALALRFYEQALRLKPGFTPAMVGAGNALAGFGQWDRAEGLFTQALSVSPALWSARLGLARVQAGRGHPRRALGMIQELWEVHPGEPVVQAHLVETLCALGDWKEALPHVQALVKASPTDPYLHALLSLCLAGRGAREEAQRERELADRLGMTEELWSGLRRSLPRPAPGSRASGVGNPL